MGMILDTCIWVNVERDRLSPADVADRTGSEPVYLAPPVIAELEYGVHRAPDPAQKNRRAAALARIKRKPCLLMDKDTADTELMPPGFIRSVFMFSLCSEWNLQEVFSGHHADVFSGRATPIPVVIHFPVNQNLKISK